MSNTLFLGLTGSIGMGKSTTTAMFKDLGVLVYDADAAVHELYTHDAVSLIEAAFPGTTNENGVDRTKLSKYVVGNEIAMKKLETIVHPLVQEKNRSFREMATSKSVRFAILDIPLLFETGGDKRVDGIIVVTAPEEIQRQRVMARAGMTAEKFAGILQRQTPDAEKRDQADFIVDTSLGMDAARQQVKGIVDSIASGNWKPGSKE